MKAYILGASAQGRVVLGILKAQYPGREIEFIDDNQKLWGSKINETNVAGGFDHLLKQDTSQFELIIALGHPFIRKKIADRAVDNCITLLNAIHPSSVIAETAEIGQGNTICAGSVINANAKICDNVVINTSTIVEHDCFIKDYVSLSSGAILGGRVMINEFAFISSGANVCKNLTVGKSSVVGAGCVVIHDVPDNVLVIGVPGKIKEQIYDNFDWQRVL
ncbi:acetyltransferase [Bacteroidales bacterium AH-315-N07]|nr:acetyltransferase [Bacteroidales bacterium AH-315-N07]